ncbi:transcriptional regulator [Bacillus sp. J14TS2]|uniref:transcriptional regulator n=1 Tax=Bacillus sp. J14TS2 TaxID=2807188 RepID=UPI001B115D8C|nr:transcriptional regulator [Bacillus sp. J14TS2]GIN69992.1 transcriptional regulator [Bacillus sp. J14TS2]
MEFGLFKNQTRFKIALELIDKKEGLSIMQLNQLLEDISQATLYRQVNGMFEDGLLTIVRKKKTRSGEENFYALKTTGYKISEEEWNQATYDEKVNFITYYYMYVLNTYQNYHKTLENKNDHSTFSISKLNLGEAEFENFQSDLNQLLTKYYNEGQHKNDRERTISLVIIP